MFSTLLLLFNSRWSYTSTNTTWPKRLQSDTKRNEKKNLYSIDCTTGGKFSAFPYVNPG